MSYHPDNFVLVEELLRQVELHLKQKSLSELSARDIALRKHYNLPVNNKLVSSRMIKKLSLAAQASFASLGYDQAEHNEIWSGKYPDVVRNEAVNFALEALIAKRLFFYIIAPNGTIVQVPYEVLNSRNGQLLFLTGEIEFTSHGVVFGGDCLFHTTDIEILFAGEACSPRHPLPPTGSGSIYRAESSEHRPHSPDQRPVSGGRPLKFDWDEIWIEICRLLLFEGAPATQTKLIERLQVWSQNRFGDEPSTTALKRRISKLYRELSLRDQGP